ncbi:hypothetical protein Mapa_013059 [Marchantia paleacea]|nr:hypothetical protein Mapa_013059 [Marchantia paleacea]
MIASRFWLLSCKEAPSGAISLSWKHQYSTPSFLINSKLARTSKHTKTCLRNVVADRRSLLMHFARLHD